MGTRAVYTFGTGEEEYHVYKHWDNYPEGAAIFLENAKGNAWQAPRFEPDDFAAAFVAANKTGPGDVRLMPSGDIGDVAPADIEYHYRVWPAPNGQLIIKAHQVDNWDGMKVLKVVFYGRLKEFIAKFQKEEQEVA